jgi:schlafen family protein
MAIFQSRRLELILGTPIDGLSVEHLREMMARAGTADPVREDFDLDFKESLYGARDEDKYRLAEDVAALANTHGGMILLGVREDRKTGGATELTPVALSDSERLRMQHIIAGNVTPPPAFEIKLIHADAGSGFFAIAVPPSPLAPHAVRAANMSLRYYRRDGSGNRPLAETEVADMYRRRFTQSAARENRLSEVWREGTQALRAEEQDRPWLATALVPGLPGSMTISARTLRTLRERWLPQFASGYFGDAPFVRSLPEASPGVARVTLKVLLGDASAPPSYGYGELHSDGSGFVAIPMHLVTPNFGDERIYIDDEQLFLSEAGIVRMLVDHAVANCGGSGDALTLTGLVAPPSTAPFRLGNARWQGMRQPFRNSRALTKVPPLPPHSISLDAVATDARERLVATRVLLADLVHAFGIAEVLQLTARGELRAQYWNVGVLDNWKGVADVPRVATTLDEEQG